MNIKKITKQLTALAMSLALSVTALVPAAHAAVDNPETVSTQTDQNLDLATQTDQATEASTTQNDEQAYYNPNDPSTEGLPERPSPDSVTLPVVNWANAQQPVSKENIEAYARSMVDVDPMEDMRVKVTPDASNPMHKYWVEMEWDVRQDTTRAPVVDLLVTVDQSGSMGNGVGTRMENSKTGILAMIDYVWGNDKTDAEKAVYRIGVIGHGSSRAEVVETLTAVGLAGKNIYGMVEYQNKDALKAVINSMTAYGDENMPLASAKVMGEKWAGEYGPRSGEYYGTPKPAADYSGLYADAYNNPNRATQFPDYKQADYRFYIGLGDGDTDSAINHIWPHLSNTAKHPLNAIYMLGTGFRTAVPKTPASFSSVGGAKAPVSTDPSEQALINISTELTEYPDMTPSLGNRFNVTTCTKPLVNNPSYKDKITGYNYYSFENAEDASKAYEAIAKHIGTIAKGFGVNVHYKTSEYFTVEPGSLYYTPVGGVEENLAASKYQLTAGDTDLVVPNVLVNPGKSTKLRFAIICNENAGGLEEIPTGGGEVGWETGGGTPVEKPIPNENVPHEKHKYTVSYLTDGSGTVSKATESVIWGNTIVGLPTTTPASGWYFSHWAVKNATGGLDEIPAATILSTQIKANAIYYAVFKQGNSPTLTFSGNTTKWTNKDVLINYVASSSDINIIKEVDETYSYLIASSAGGSKLIPNTTTAYNGSKLFSENGMLAITATSSVTNLSVSGQEVVELIDKTAPDLDATALKTAATNNTIITSAGQFTGMFSYIDIGDGGGRGTESSPGKYSGIDYDKSIFVIRDASGAIVKSAKVREVSGLDVSDLVGTYYYDIVIVDNAGNMTDSFGNKYDTSGKPGTEDPGTKTPEDIIKNNPKDDPDHKLVFNAKVPVITFSGNTTKWTNKDVTVNYVASSTDGTVIGEVDETYSYLSTSSAGGSRLIPNTTTVYRDSKVFSENGTLSITATSSISKLSAKGQEVVQLIDKTAPDLDATALKTAATNNTIITSAGQFTGMFSYIDIGDNSERGTASSPGQYSGIDYDKSIFVIRDASGAIVKSAKVREVSGLDVSDLVGTYYYDIVIVDNAGNMTDSFGNKYDTSGGSGTEDPGTKTPEDIIKNNPKDDPDHKLVFNAKVPVITFSGNTTKWTNKNVTVNYVASSTDGTVIGEVDETYSYLITSSAGGSRLIPNTTTAYNGSKVFSENGTLSITATSSISKLSAKGQEVVELIDKTAPELNTTALKTAATSNKVIASASELAGMFTYIDIGDGGGRGTKSSLGEYSGVDYDKSIFVIRDASGTIVKSAKVDKVSALDVSDLVGAFYYDIVIVDNAGNMTDSFGHKYDTSGKPGTEDPGTKTPEDIIKNNPKDDPDHKLVFNAGDPTFTITAPTPASSANGYFNADTYLTVNYRAESDVPLVDLTITGSDSVSVKLSGAAIKAIETKTGAKYIYEGTFVTKQAKGITSTVTYNGTVKDEIDGVANSSASIKFDGVAPTITIPSDITQASITVEDVDSGMAQSIVVMTKKGTSSPQTITVNGSDNNTIDAAIKAKLDTTGSGIYEIKITSTDNVGNVSTKTAETYYESATAASDISISFSQAPLVSVMTNQDVTVTYTITSDVRLGTITIDDKTAQDVSSVSANTSGKYIYTGTVSVEHNRDVDVKYVTDALKVAATGSHYVPNIDKQKPEIDEASNQFKDGGSLAAATPTKVRDIVDATFSSDVISGVKNIMVSAVPITGGNAITGISASSTVGGASATFEDAIQAVIAKKSGMVNIYNVTVSITDNAGNVRSYLYNNMTMDGTTNPEQPTVTSNDWEVQLVNDTYPKFIQLEIQATGSNKQAPSTIKVVQFNGAATLSETALNVTSVNKGIYRTNSVLRNSLADNITIIINSGAPISYTLPSSVQTGDINFGTLTTDSNYSWSVFSTTIYNGITPISGNVTIISKTIKQYNSIALANADKGGASGTTKTLASSKTPLAKAKPTRILVTYEKGGVTYTEASVPFYIQN